MAALLGEKAGRAGVRRVAQTRSITAAYLRKSASVSQGTLRNSTVTVNNATLVATGRLENYVARAYREVDLDDSYYPRARANLSAIMLFFLADDPDAQRVAEAP